MVDIREAEMIDLALAGQEEAEAFEKAEAEREAALIDDVRNGDYARQLLDNGYLADYRRRVRDQLIEAIQQCDAKDDMGRFRLAQCLATLDRFWTHIEQGVEDGELSSRQLEALRRGKDRRFF